MAKRHSLLSLFAAIFRPFADAWRDEFGPGRRAAKTPEKQAIPAPQMPDSVPVVEQPARPPISWRESVAERLEAEPPGVRHRPRPQVAPKAKGKSKPRAKAKAGSTKGKGKPGAKGRK